MGRIGRMIQTAIEKFIVQTVETYAGVNITADTFAPSGDDSPPLAEDRIVLVQVDGTGHFVAVGVLTESQGAKPGEKILFSRDADGEVQAALKLLNDGKVELVSPAEVSLTAKKISAAADEELSAKGDTAEIEGAKSLTLKSADAKITGGKLTVNGAVTPSGSGPFCGIPACLFTGAPQCGTMVSGT